MKRIRVNVMKPYDVLIGNSILPNTAGLAGQSCASGRVAIITDDVVEALYLPPVRESFERAGVETLCFSFPHGEQSKNLQTLSALLEYLAEKRFRRNDTIVALGGGVVGDTAGFAASVYMRGVPFIQIPTTLLSAVDASVGGKTGVDLKNGKNLAGSFWQPSLVLCDTEVLARLPRSVFREGMAEVIKYGIIRDIAILEKIQNGTLAEDLESVIYDCAALKAEIVEQDEFDLKGIRNVLNAGHTVGHAIEKLSGYTVSHGQSVGTGLLVEALMAKELGLCDPISLERIRQALESCGLVTALPWTPEMLAAAMKSDKKNRSAQIVFEFPCSIGSVKELSLDSESVVDLLQKSIRQLRLPPNTTV